MNYRAYFAIEKKMKSQGFDPDRKDLVNTFTGGKKTGLTQLSATEYHEFIAWLKLRFELSNSEDKQVRDKKRKRVIAHMCGAGYVNAITGKPDMPTIESWVLQQKHKKPFNSLSSKELSELIVAAQGVERHFNNMVNRRK